MFHLDYESNIQVVCKSGVPNFDPRARFSASLFLPLHEQRLVFQQGRCERPLLQLPGNFSPGVSRVCRSSKLCACVQLAVKTSGICSRGFCSIPAEHKALFTLGTISPTARVWRLQFGDRYSICIQIPPAICTWELKVTYLGQTWCQVLQLLTFYACFLQPHASWDIGGSFNLRAPCGLRT